MASAHFSINFVFIISPVYNLCVHLCTIRSLIRHGVANEGPAREIYKSSCYVDVVETYLVVPPLHPWLGYSPDGVEIQDGKAIKLIEIKCPLKEEFGAADIF